MNTPARILVVENSPLVAEDLRDIVVRLGFDAPPPASSATEALHRAQEAKPDLVLMDIRLDGPEDGIAAAARLRARFGLQVVYVTAHADPITLDRAMETVPLGYLIKPFSEPAVETAIRTALGQLQAQATNESHARWVLAALEEAPDAVVAVDSSCAITFVNATARKMMTQRSDHLLGKPVDDWLLTTPRLSETIQPVLAGGPRADRDLHLGDPSCGVHRRLLATMVRDTDGAVRGALLQVRDPFESPSLPVATICAYCQSVRREDERWEPVTSYLRRTLGMLFSHGICPACFGRVIKS